VDHHIDRSQSLSRIEKSPYLFRIRRIGAHALSRAAKGFFCRTSGLIVTEIGHRHGAPVSRKSFRNCKPNTSYSADDDHAHAPTLLLPTIFSPECCVILRVSTSTGRAIGKKGTLLSS
jgi:hypothetical protein